MGFVRYGRDNVRVGLCIMLRGEVEKGFSEGGCVIGIGKTKRGGYDQVSEGIQCRFVVTMVR